MTDIKSILDDLHGELAKEFLKRVREGTATAADLSAARQFLKDNHIEAVPKPDTPLHNLVDELPFTGEDTIIN